VPAQSPQNPEARAGVTSSSHRSWGADVERVPRDELPAGGMAPDVAYQINSRRAHAPNGNARLNLATL